MDHKQPSIWFSVTVSIPVLPQAEADGICLWLPPYVARIADEAAKKADLVDEFIRGGGTKHLQNADFSRYGTDAGFTFAGPIPLDVEKIKLFEREMTIGVVNAFKDYANKLADIAKKHLISERRLGQFGEQADSMPNTPVRT